MSRGAQGWRQHSCLQVFEKLTPIGLLSGNIAMAHPMEAEYMMLETFTEAQPGAAVDPELDAEVGYRGQPQFCAAQ